MWSDCSVALCRHVMGNRAGLVEGREVLELASGAGAVGLIVAQLGPRTLVLSDSGDEVLKLLQQNVRDSCGSTPSIRVQNIDVNSCTAPSQTFDTILVSDATFSEKMAAAVARSIGLHGRPGARAVVTHTIRKAIFLQDGVVQMEKEDSALVALVEGLRCLGWEVAVHGGDSGVATIEATMT